MILAKQAADENAVDENGNLIGGEEEQEAVETSGSSRIPLSFRSSARYVPIPIIVVLSSPSTESMNPSREAYFPGLSYAAKNRRFSAGEWVAEQAMQMIPLGSYVAENLYRSSYLLQGALLHPALPGSS